MMEPATSASPLGVFDSGLGGLTVVRALRARCPEEDIVYLGDTARVPYGSRSPETVIRYALGCARVLTARGVKAIIVACNTVSAVALDMLRVELDLPVLGVILPGARAAVAASGGGLVGVLGTTGTIASGAYPRAVASFSTRTEVVGQAAPLLVPLAEEGWTEGEVPRLVARRYLEPLIAAGARCVLLGCTHYPLLRATIEEEAAALAGVPMPIVVAGLAYVVAHALLYHTRFGTYVFAIGGNREALGLAGVRVDAYHAAIYALGGVFVGVAALLLTARINSGPPTVAIGMEFDAVAAVILGGTSFERGEGWIFGTLLGVIAVGMLRNGLDLLAVPSSLQSVSIGLLVIVTLLLDRVGMARA